MSLRSKDLNKHIVAAQYAVRGALALRAEELRDILAQNPSSLPFNEVINANIGNPQQLDQKPITFFRQVLALVQYPPLIDNPPSFIKPDAVRRAKHLLKHIGSVGAYSTSNGVPVIRQSIAKFIEERDGFPADPNSIYLTAGASSGVRLIMTLLASPGQGFMIPIPQYPLYSATIAMEGLEAIEYYLNEKENWTLQPAELEKRIQEAKERGVMPRMLVVINPGNPTGSVMPTENIRAILKLAHKHNMVVLADEVYQTNVFEGEFVSFRKVRQQLVQEDPTFESLQLASLHSASKGFVGECGQRGGYIELVGFHPELAEQFYKMASVMLCPVVTGQVLMELIVNPPKEGDESYEEYSSEIRYVSDTLRERAFRLYETFKTLEGVECNPPQGAMYLYPTIRLPEGAIAEAKRRGVEPDEMYCMDLLNSTGICVVPGSGFLQEVGTYHFRTTFLAPAGHGFSERFSEFHHEFMKKWSKQ